MCVTFRDGQSALKAVEFSGMEVGSVSANCIVIRIHLLLQCVSHVQLEGQHIVIVLRTEKWLDVIEKELRLCGNNTVGLCEDSVQISPQAVYCHTFNPIGLEDSFDGNCFLYSRIIRCMMMGPEKVV